MWSTCRYSPRSQDSRTISTLNHTSRIVTRQLTNERNEEEKNQTNCGHSALAALRKCVTWKPPRKNWRIIEKTPFTTTKRLTNETNEMQQVEDAFNNRWNFGTPSRKQFFHEKKNSWCPPVPLYIYSFRYEPLFSCFIFLGVLYRLLCCGGTRGRNRKIYMCVSFKRL